MEMRIFDMPIDDMHSHHNHNHDDVLTMAFVNFQPLNEVYNASEAFRRGSLFPNIDKPFCPGGMRK